MVIQILLEEPNAVFVIRLIVEFQLFDVHEEVHNVKRAIFGKLFVLHILSVSGEQADVFVFLFFKLVFVLHPRELTVAGEIYQNIGN